VAAKTVRQALLTPWPRAARSRAVAGRDAVTAREVAGWAAGTGRAVAELTAELVPRYRGPASGMPGSGPGSRPAAAASRRAR
jgi:hypothetical protein